METPQTTETSQLTKEQLYELVAHLIFNEDKNQDEVKQTLIQQYGLNEEAAGFVINEVVINHVTSEARDERASQAKKDIIYGALWCGGGTIVTVATYSAASGGGSYVVAWGAIVFGAIQLIKGLVNYSSR